MPDGISSDAKSQFVDLYYEGADQVPNRWEDAYLWRDDDAPSLKLAVMSSEVSRLPQWVDGASDVPQAKIKDIGSKVVNFAQYAIQMRIRKLDARHDPTLVPRVYRGLGRAVSNTKALIAAAVFNGAHSTTKVVPGAKALAATDHPTASGGARSNKIASACDLTAIYAAMTLARNWVDYDDGDFDVAEMGWHLIHPTVAGLEQTVAQALGSQYTSDQLQVNTAGSFGITQVPWAKVTNSTHWGLVSKALKPLHFWEHIAAEDSVDIDEDSRQIKITIDGAWAAFCVAQPSGFIGAAT